MQKGPEECEDCGVRKGFLQTQVRKLTEKLEHAELQIHELAFECAQLHEALKVARWQSHSSLVPRRECTQLPDELLHEIFLHATSIDGLAFSPWNLETKGRSWDISSRTRRSITLVCKQWNIIGTQFLYEHIVLSQASQISHLLDVLKSRDEMTLHQHTNWIRGIELNPGSEHQDAVKRFWACAPELANLLPRSRLRVFGMNALEYPKDTSPTLTAVTTFLGYFSENLEILHWPFVWQSVDWNCFLETGIEPRDAKSPVPPRFPRVHTLSITNGRWDLYNPADHGLSFNPLLFLRGHLPALKYLSFVWPKTGIDVIARFIETNRNLEKIHIEETPYSYFLPHHFDSFLRTVPHLKHLTISLSDAQLEINYIKPSQDPHFLLEEIVLMMNRGDTISTNALRNIFDKIKTRDFPGLRRIVLYGQFYGGCLDRGFIMSNRLAILWQEAIDICAHEGIELVNSHGDAIYLWRIHEIKPDRHRIKLKEYPGSEVEEDIENDDGEASGEADESFDESRWSTAEDSDHPIIYTSEDENENSSDSEDGQYRYSFAPDLNYETDSGTSSESL